MNLVQHETHLRSRFKKNTFRWAGILIFGANAPKAL